MSASPSTPASNSKANVLVADAESKSRASIVMAFKRKGYAVQDASTPQDALACLQTQRPELVILDPQFPHTDAVDLMRRVRAVRRDLAIVILTSQATADNAIAAVKINAVDFLIKPCKPDDLLLVVARALAERAQQTKHQRLLEMVTQAMDALRQTEDAEVAAVLPLPPGMEAVAPSPDIVQIGVLTLDRQKRMAWLRTNPARRIELTEGEVAILVALIEKPNQVLTCNQLARTALGYQDMDKWTVENVVRSAVFRLRQKLEADADAPQLIRTVRGRGYFFSPA